MKEEEKKHTADTQNIIKFLFMTLMISKQPFAAVASVHINFITELYQNGIVLFFRDFGSWSFSI